MHTDDRVVPLRQVRHAECSTCPRNQVCFSRFADGDLASSLEGLRVSTRLLHRGDHVFFSGQPCTSLAIVKSGHVKTTIVSAEGEEQITGFCGPGELLGADGLATKLHNVDVVALGTVSVCIMNIDTLLRAGTRHEVLVNILSGQIVSGERLLLTLGKLDAEQRLAAFLLEQSRARQRAGFSERCFTLPMSRADIGNHLNLAVETVSRLFTRFRQRGLIRFERNEVHWLDVDGLAKVREEPLGCQAAG